MKKAVNLYRKYTHLKISVLFIAVGLIFSVITGTMFLGTDKGTYEKINATITSIESQNIGKNTLYSLSLTYEVNGKKYESSIYTYESDCKVGGEFECEYNVDDPVKLRDGDTSYFALVFCLVSLGVLAYGIILLVKGLKSSSDEYLQYDRVKESDIDTYKAEEIRNRGGENEEFVFHFSGNPGQSYVMEDSGGNDVCEALCDSVKILKDTEVEFRNNITGYSSAKMISHTISYAYGSEHFNANIKSFFKIDGETCWEVLASMGYGFDFSLNHLKPHYEVRHMGVNIGYAEAAGTGAVNKKYENNPLGKLAAKGIFKVSCPRSEIDGMFLICYCLSKTEISVM